MAVAPVNRYFRSGADSPSTTVGEVAADVLSSNRRTLGENKLARFLPSRVRIARDGSVAETRQSHICVVQRQGCSVLHVQTIGASFYITIGNVQSHILQGQCSIGGNRDGVTVLGLGVDFELALPIDGNVVVDGDIRLQGGVLQQGDGAAVSCNSVQGLRQRVITGIANTGDILGNGTFIFNFNATTIYRACLL